MFLRCSLRSTCRAIGSIAVLAGLACAAGCMPTDGDSTPWMPETTTTRIAPANDGVRMLDLFGDWFFIMRTADGQPVFTARGDFTVSPDDGRIVYDANYIVQGFRVDGDGKLMIDKLRDLRIEIGSAGPVRGTSRVVLEGNVNPDDVAVGDLVDATFGVFDDNGIATSIYVAIKLVAKMETGVAVQLDVRLESADGELLNRAAIGFDSSGALVDQPTVRVVSVSPPLTFSLELDKLTASGRINTSLEAGAQDGLGESTLGGYRIRNDGTIVGQYSNDAEFVVGRFVIARFDNAKGLAPVPGRNDVFVPTAESGSPRPAVSVAE